MIHAYVLFGCTKAKSQEPQARKGREGSFSFCGRSGGLFYVSGEKGISSWAGAARVEGGRIRRFAS